MFRRTLAIVVSIFVAVAAAGFVAIRLSKSTSSPPPGAAGHPLFDLAYLDGVSGPQPTENIDLAGTWQFAPLMGTTCKATGTLGPQTGV